VTARIPWTGHHRRARHRGRVGCRAGERRAVKHHRNAPRRFPTLRHSPQRFASHRITALPGATRHHSTQRNTLKDIEQ
jgi:hypothetical protein